MANPQLAKKIIPPSPSTVLAEESQALARLSLNSNSNSNDSSESGELHNNTGYPGYPDGRFPPFADGFLLPHAQPFAPFYTQFQQGYGDEHYGSPTFGQSPGSPGSFAMPMSWYALGWGMSPDGRAGPGPDALAGRGFGEGDAPVLQNGERPVRGIAVTVNSSRSQPSEEQLMGVFSEFGATEVKQGSGGRSIVVFLSESQARAALETVDVRDRGWKLEYVQGEVSSTSQSPGQPTQSNPDVSVALQESQQSMSEAMMPLQPFAWPHYGGGYPLFNGMSLAGALQGHQGMHQGLTGAMVFQPGSPGPMMVQRTPFGMGAPPFHPGGVGNRGVSRMNPALGRPQRQRSSSDYDPTLYEFSVEEACSKLESARTTLMIRNIPNKYNQKMLLDMLDRRYSGMYDFFYLPIDFKNKCNLGYAFVNFLDASTTADFYKELHHKRWEEFNSKKVCEITYARVQGRDSLIDHFKNSKFPCDELDCLPLVFETVEQNGQPCEADGGTTSPGSTYIKVLPISHFVGPPPAAVAAH